MRREGVGHPRHERTWVSLLAVLARVLQRETGATVGSERLSGPQDLIEAADAPMQRVLSDVLGEVVRRAVEGELRIPDAIGVPADDRAEVGHVLEVPRETVEAEHDRSEERRVGKERRARGSTAE